MKPGVARVLDMAIACVSVAATLPLLLVIALAIKLEGPGPVFYRTPRIGRDGRRFDILHFRTVRFDPQRGGMRTGIGEFLYATRMDCLPQLFNVLRGELSILGTETPTWCG